MLLGADTPRDLGAGPGRGLTRNGGNDKEAHLPGPSSPRLSVSPSIKDATRMALTPVEFSEESRKNDEGPNIVCGTKFWSHTELHWQLRARATCSIAPRCACPGQRQLQGQ